MTEHIRISQQAARRFVLGKQGLWPGRRWEGVDGTRAAITACEHLQLDPLVIVARSHDLMLHARVAGYRPEFFDQLTYADRAFFDWGGWLAVRPMEELPHWRTLMRREREHVGMREIAEAHGDVIEAMRGTLKERGTVSNRDFEANAKAISNYRGSKDTSLALYYLWRTGEAMTHHRDGFQRVYALSEAVAPGRLLTEVPELDADLFICRKSVAFGGIGRLGVARAAPLKHVLGRPIDRTEAIRLENLLVERGDLVPVEVEGWRGNNFMLPEDVALLAEVESGQIPAEWHPLGPSTKEEVTFLSPLDPVSARGRAKALFDFDYLWEIYMPEAKMQYGRYTMPILWGDQLVGRIDPKMDRASGTLVINGVWFEDAALVKDEAFVAALAAGVTSLMAFLGAKRVDATAVANRTMRARLTKAGRASVQ